MIKYYCDNCLKEFEPIIERALNAPYFPQSKNDFSYTKSDGEHGRFHACSLRCASEYANKKEAKWLRNQYYVLDKFMDKVLEGSIMEEVAEGICPIVSSCKATLSQYSDESVKKDIAEGHIKCLCEDKLDYYYPRELIA